MSELRSKIRGVIDKYAQSVNGSTSSAWVGNDALIDEVIFTAQQAAQKCHVCLESTGMGCSDCRMNFGATVYVCGGRECRDSHELKCYGDGSKRPPIYVAHLDEVPFLSVRAHEVCDGEVTSEEVVAMWLKLKQRYETAVVKTIADLRDYMAAATPKNPLVMIDEFAAGYRKFLAQERCRVKPSHKWEPMGVTLDNEPPITHCCVVCGVYQYPSNVDGECAGLLNRRLATEVTQ